MKRFLTSVIIAVLTFGAPASALAAAAQDGKPNNAALRYWQAFALAPQSKENQEWIDSWDRVELDAQVILMLKSADNALKYFHAGTELAKCDWGLDRAEGPELLLPHLVRARDLARLALLRARYRFHTGDFPGGIDDATAVLKLGRDVGDPIVIGTLVQYLIQNNAVDTIAADLPKLDRASLDLLTKRLNEIPAVDQLHRAWNNESTYFIDWVVARFRKDAEECAGDQAKWEQHVLSIPGLDPDKAAELKRIGVPPPEKFIPVVESIKPFLKEMEGVMDLPPAEQSAKLAELEKEFESRGALEKAVIPKQAKIFEARHRWQVRQAMLRAAVAVQRDGTEALKQPTFVDPFGSGAFDYKKTPGGFELTSKLTIDGEVVTVTVGSAK